MARRILLPDRRRMIDLSLGRIDVTDGFVFAGNWCYVKIGWDGLDGLGI
jgi:hypothetical protein